MGAATGFRVGYPPNDLASASHRPMSEPTAPSPPSRTAAGWLGLILRVAATVGLMGWAVKDIEWGTFRGLLAAANWPWWLAALAVTLVGAGRRRHPVGGLGAAAGL